MGIGILIFVFIYKDLQLSKIEDALQNLHYEWIVLSGIFGLTSHYIRALRWNLLIEPLSHKPGIINTYLSVLVLYLFNILIPRGGEVARCTVINRYEKISFTSLLGTVVSERLADLGTFLVILVVLMLWDLSYFEQLMNNNPDLARGVAHVGSNGVAVIAVIAGAVALGVVLYKKTGSGNKYKSLLVKLFSQFRQGLRTIRNTRSIWLFIFYTFAIIFLWLLMLYVVFFAYEPTSNLSFQVAVITFAISSFAFVLPIQAGLGAWHFIVIQCLLLFGVDMDHGSVFALVAHTFSNLIFLVAGTLAFILLPVVNNHKAKKLRFKDVASEAESHPGVDPPADG